MLVFPLRDILPGCIGPGQFFILTDTFNMCHPSYESMSSYNWPSIPLIFGLKEGNACNAEKGSLPGKHVGFQIRRQLEVMAILLA